MNTLTTWDSDVRDKPVADVYEFPTVCGMDPAGAKVIEYTPLSKGSTINDEELDVLVLVPAKYPYLRLKLSDSESSSLKAPTYW
jgi:hypothetical protein